MTNTAINDLDKYSAPALDKGLDILELLSNVNSGLTQSEIALTLGRSVSEIFRMLVVLRRREMISLNEHSDRYFLTTKIFELSQKVPTVKRLTTIADPVMNRLAATCGQTVHLAIVSGASIVIVGIVENPGNHVFYVRLGARIDFWKTSSGPVIMAHQNVSVARQFFDQCPHPGEFSNDEIMTQFDRIRSKRLQQMVSPVMKGVTNISAPVIQNDGSAVAALTMPYIELHPHLENLSLQDCCTKLIDASLEISQQIGASSL